MAHIQSDNGGEDPHDDKDGGYHVVQLRLLEREVQREDCGTEVARSTARCGRCQRCAGSGNNWRLRAAEAPDRRLTR